IVKPTIKDTLSVLNDINIELNMSDNTEMHESTVDVTDSAGNVVFTDNPYVHELQNYTYKSSFKIASIDRVRLYTMKVTLADHSDNIETQTVSFFMKP
ncbi:MAG: hypothetical protein HYZ42_15470, partial [Bacteroidetes bacterium]|nr:hypothetical protein [Bacteroidota bacterium]